MQEVNAQIEKDSDEANRTNTQRRNKAKKSRNKKARSQNHREENKSRQTREDFTLGNDSTDEDTPQAQTSQEREREHREDLSESDESFEEHGVKVRKRGRSVKKQPESHDSPRGRGQSFESRSRCFQPPSSSWNAMADAFAKSMLNILTQPLPFPMGLRSLTAPPREKLDAIRKCIVSDACRSKDIVRMELLGTDTFLDHPSVIHPMIRVHIVDAFTGQYIRKANVKRELGRHEPLSVIYGQERNLDGESDRCPYVLPVMSKPATVDPRTGFPSWEAETIVIVEPYSTILAPHVLFLVEVVDFGPTVTARQMKRNGGLAGIAWAFLRPVSATGLLNVGHRSKDKTASAFDASQLTDFPIVQLDMFHWQDLGLLGRAQADARGISTLPGPASPEVPPVYLQWLCKNRRSFPATLALRVGPLPMPDEQLVEHRPTQPFQTEVPRTQLRDVLSSGGPSSGLTAVSPVSVRKSLLSSALESMTPPDHVLRRSFNPFGHDRCVTPDRVLCRVSCGREGATVVRYAPSGKYLAVAGCDSPLYPVLVYDLDSKDGGAILKATLQGHQSLVYDLQWSADEQFVVSASADGTARVWSVKTVTQPLAVPAVEAESGQGSNPPAAAHSYPKLVSTLQHSPPCFLYCAVFVQSPGSAAKPLILSKVPFADTRGLDGEALSPSDFEIGLAVEGLEDTVWRRGTVVSIHTDDTVDIRCEREPRDASGVPHVITGGFNGTVRLWDASEPIAEDLGVVGETGGRHVASMAIDRIHRRLYCGDGQGVVWIWRWERDGSAARMYHADKPLRSPKLRGKTVTSLRIRPQLRQASLSDGSEFGRPRRHLLVYAHGSTLLLFDMSTQAELVQYSGADSESSLLRADFSPDGRVVVAGSEDGEARFWDAWSGSRVPCSASLRVNAPLVDVCWNSKQHCVAVACMSGSFPVVVTFAESKESFTRVKTPAMGQEALEEKLEDQVDHHDSKIEAVRRKLERSQRVKQKLADFKSRLTKRGNPKEAEKEAAEGDEKEDR